MYKYGDKGPGLRTEGSAQVTRSPQPPSETGSASSQDEATRLSPSALPDGGLPKRLALMPEVGCENYLLGGPITWGQALSVGHRGRKGNELHHQCPLPPGHTCLHRPGEGRLGGCGPVSSNTYLQGCLPVWSWPSGSTQKFPSLKSAPGTCCVLQRRPQGSIVRPERPCLPALVCPSLMSVRQRSSQGKR